jgi:GGDEF domain-containing protein
MRRVLIVGELAARLGGKEFSLLLPDVEDIPP